MSRYRLESTGLWGDHPPHGWHPAITGTVNQTGESDEVASTFEAREEAILAFELAILPCLPEDDDARDNRPRFRLATLDGEGHPTAFEML